MFSLLPPVISFPTGMYLQTMPYVSDIYHATVHDPSYQSWGIDRQDETHCIFHYTVRGHGEVICRGNTSITEPGQGFFNIINEIGSGYRYPESSTEPWEFVAICFVGDNVRNVVLEMQKKAPLFTVPDPERFAKMCEKLLDNDYPDMRAHLFPLLLTMLLEHSNNILPLVDQFHKTVQQHIQINPTISEIAGKMGISREHLQREYVQQTGVTPAKYIRKKRFEQLCYLLADDKDDDEVTQQMHFSSVTEMRQFFKRNAGITPKQYRKKQFLIP